MSYTVKKQYISSSKLSLKAPHSMKARYITIHNTFNDASAKNEIAYMGSNNSMTGFHVAIDDKEAIIGVPYNRNTWACGDGAFGGGNRESVSIEICYSKSGGQRYKEAEANAIDFTAKLLIELGLTPDKVRYHQEWSGKNCPHRILDERRGTDFKKAIKKRYDELKYGTKPKPSAPAKADDKGTLYRVFDAKGKQIGAYKTKKNADALKAKHAGSKVKKFVDGKEVVASKPKADVRIVTSDTLNVREGAGANYKIITTVKKGDAFTVVKTLSNGWVQLKSGGYVNSEYLKKA